MLVIIIFVSCPGSLSSSSSLRSCSSWTDPAAAPPPDALQRDVYPAARSFAFPRREFHEIITAHTGQENHLCRRVALVEFEVKVHANLDHGDKFEEVQGQRMWLGSIRLPVLLGRRMTEGSYAAAWFVG